MKNFTKYLYLFTFMAILMVALSACIPTPTSTPPPTALPPTPEPILYLVIKPEQRAPCYTNTTDYVALSQTLHAGDAVPVRDSRNWEGFWWYEILAGHLLQFPTGTTCWVKFKVEKMYLEWR